MLNMCVCVCVCMCVCVVCKMCRGWKDSPVARVLEVLGLIPYVYDTECIDMLLGLCAWVYKYVCILCSLYVGLNVSADDWNVSLDVGFIPTLCAGTQDAHLIGMSCLHMYVHA